MTNRRFFSLISLSVSVLAIAIIVKINNDIARQYLQSDGKTRGLFGIIEVMSFYYQFYFFGLSLLAFVFAIIGSKRKEIRLLNTAAYIISLFSVMLIFIGLWKVMI